jgi:mitotic spindle assembly checkpoint protein MAD1
MRNNQQQEQEQHFSHFLFADDDDDDVDANENQPPQLLNTSETSLSQIDYERFIKKRRLSELYVEEIEKKDLEVYSLKTQIQQLQQHLNNEKLKSSEFEIQYKNEHRRSQEFRQLTEQALEKAQRYKEELAFLRTEQLNHSTIVLEQIENNRLNESSINGSSILLQQQQHSDTAIIELEKNLIESQDTIDQLNLQMDTLRGRNRTMEHELSNLKLQLADSQDKEKETIHQLFQLQNEIEKTKLINEQLEKRISHSSHVEIELKYLKDELTRLHTVEKQHQQLLHRHSELETRVGKELLLTEEISDLKRRLQRIAELEVELQTVHTKLSNTEQTLNKWEDSFTGRSPGEIAHELKTMQQQVNRLNTQIESTNNSKIKIESEYRQAQNEFKNCQLVLVNKESEVTNLKQQVNDLEIKYHTLLQENMSNKQMLASYDQEEAIMKGGLEKVNRIEELERIIAQKDASLETINSKIHSLTSQLNEQMRNNEIQRVELEKLQKELVSTQSEANQYKQQQESLVLERADMEKAIAEYERRIGRGEYNKETMKILHLTMNPETISKAQHSTNELEKLRSEIVLLKAENEKLQNSVNSEESLQDLKEKLFQSEKKNLRFKEAFQQQIKKFRAGIYRLFGWRVDIMDENFRLSSMYAESSTDYLVFKESMDSGMELMESDYASQIEPHLLEYLNSYQSIPLFLSKVTSELFQKQTHVAFSGNRIH